MENPTKMDDFGGTPILGNLHMNIKTTFKTIWTMRGTLQNHSLQFFLNGFQLQGALPVVIRNRMVSKKEKSSLCFSKRERQMFL